MLTTPPCYLFSFGFSESLYLLWSNMKRYGSSWLEFSSLRQSELLQEHHRNCKDCKHIDCLAAEDRLSPRWSPTASSSRYSVRGGKEYHLLPLSKGRFWLHPLGSKGFISECINRNLATATLFITLSCFIERSLNHGWLLYWPSLMYLRKKGSLESSIYTKGMEMLLLLFYMHSEWEKFGEGDVYYLV